jgi:cytochrome c oxidase assembly protein subunit 15
MMLPVARKLIGLWLLTGCCMVFFQVIVGGVTRLTQSGLSITEWKPIKGIVPPLNEHEWTAEFNLYKQKVQYQTMNEGMSLAEFKLIYFWEYFHRFWARFMGMVFAVGFIYFLYRRWFNKDLLYKIAPLFVWGAIEGAYGWLMVSKGLKGISVPPIHLSIHLVIALSLFAYLVWLTLYVFRPERNFGKTSRGLRTLGLIILVLHFVQLFLGGLTSGMKAGLAYPTWPDMNGQFIPSALFTEKANSSGFMIYNAQDLWGRTLVQFVHRLTAYTLIVLILIFFFKSRHITNDRIFKIGLNILPLLVLIQASIGIITVLNCVGKIPVALGVLHQAGAMLLIAATVFVIFHLNYTTHER